MMQHLYAWAVDLQDTALPYLLFAGDKVNLKA